MRCLTEQEKSEILRSSSADLFQSHGLSLRMTNAIDNHNECGHPEQSEGSLTACVSIESCLTPHPSLLPKEKGNSCCHAELVSASLSERIGEFPSPRKEGVGERVLSFAKIKPLKHIIKKCAFTLAEVLITLGIIGVVAAITLPNLITDYKARILRSQFQKAYARVEQVHREMVAAEEYLPFSLQDNNYTREYPSLIASHLAGAKAPKAGDWWNGGTIQSYFKKLGYGDMSGNIGSQLLWYIDDGYVELPTSEIWWIENGTGQQAITVDINGYNNKPNRWGYDLFTFFYDEEKDAYIPDYHGNCDNLRNLSISNYNGRSCASKAANDPNYFKKLLRKQKL